MSTHFTILMLGYNSLPFIEKSLASALGQEYDNFDVIAIDAATNDGTWDLLSRYQDDPRLTTVRNERRRYVVENTFSGCRIAKPGTVMVQLDFDDWLASHRVLSILDEVYSAGDVWMTYGTYTEYPPRDVSHLYSAYPHEVIEANSFRTYSRWLASHLRTFRRELCLQIDQDALRGPDGEFVKTAGDVALMYPMLEMAGHHSRYVPEILYVYNKLNPLSDDRVDPVDQEHVAAVLRGLPPQQPLRELV